MDWVDPASFLPAGYEVVRRTVTSGSLRAELFLVADPNALSDSLDPASFAEDERFPYWAELWPSGVALARFVARLALVQGVPTLELGCGLGLAGVAAAQRGADVTFTDFDADALAFARSNHALNLGAPGRVLRVDWRNPPADLSGELVLASDVLYERRFLGPLLSTVRAALSPGGTAYLAEPGRKIAENTVESLEAEGFSRELHLEEVELGGRVHSVWIHELKR